MHTTTSRVLALLCCTHRLFNSLRGTKIECSRQLMIKSMRPGVAVNVNLDGIFCVKSGSYFLTKDVFQIENKITSAFKTIKILPEASSTLRCAFDTLSLKIPRTRISTAGSCAFSVFGHLRGMILPFLSGRNSLWIPSAQISRHFFSLSQNNRTTMFSTQR